MKSEKLSFSNAIKRVAFASIVLTVFIFIFGTPSVLEQSPANTMKFLLQLSTGFFIGLLTLPILYVILLQLEKRVEDTGLVIFIGLSAMIILAAITQVLVINQFPGSEIYLEKINMYLRSGPSGLITTFFLYFVIGLMGASNCLLGAMLDLHLMDILEKRLKKS